MWYGETTLKFICYQPFALGRKDRRVTESNEVFSNPGTVLSYPKIKLNSSGGSTSFTCGKKTLKLELPAREQEVEIDSAKGTIYVNGQRGLKYMTLDSEFPIVSPKVDKVLTNATTFEMIYRPRYL